MKTVEKIGDVQIERCKRALGSLLTTHLFTYSIDLSTQNFMEIRRSDGIGFLQAIAQGARAINPYAAAVNRDIRCAVFSGYEADGKPYPAEGPEPAPEMRSKLFVFEFTEPLDREKFERISEIVQERIGDNSGRGIGILFVSSKSSGGSGFKAIFPASESLDEPEHRRVWTWLESVFKREGLTPGSYPGISTMISPERGSGPAWLSVCPGSGNIEFRNWLDKFGKDKND